MTIKHNPAKRHGLLLILSSPSGAGKSTIARLLLEQEQDISLSISATTRPPRANETDGVDYHFIDQARFDQMVAGDEFLESAQVFGNNYGTPRAEVEALLAQGKDILFDIDWQGSQQLHAKASHATVRIFILPPDLAELSRRLHNRATDSEKVIAARMARAKDEISHWEEYDYVLINDDSSQCLTQVRTILAAERLKRERNPYLIDLTATLIRND